jgi:Holliday junction resolvase-like predicted endonuclease
MPGLLPADADEVAYEVETRPGGWVAAQAARRARLVWLGLGLFFLVDGVVLALAVGHRLSIVGAALFLSVVIAAKPYADRYVDKQLRWRKGAQAEEAVGETLNELRREGWVLMHDIERVGEGNIDHIASGPDGVFLVETKARRYEEAHLVKAKRQAARLHDELGVWVTPVICLHTRKAKPFRTHGVWVVPHERLLDWLREQHNQPVAFERLARFADRV